MKLSQFRFDFPLNLIAQTPTKRREDARLMVVHKDNGLIENKTFKEILDYFEEKERVYPAKPLNISIAQRHLNQLFYDFMVYYDFKTTYDKYGNYFAILKRTFQKRYYNTELTSFKSNFSRKYDNYPFKTLR